EIGDRDSLIVFPEGTRGSGRIPGPFKSGLYYLLSTRPDLEAMPVYLDNMNRILPKGESVPVPMLSRAIFGRAMKIGPGEGKTEFLGWAGGGVVGVGEVVGGFGAGVLGGFAGGLWHSSSRRRSSGSFSPGARGRRPPARPSRT